MALRNELALVMIIVQEVIVSLFTRSRATHPKSPAFVEPRSIYIRRGEIRVDFARWVEGNGEYHHVQRLLNASVMGQRYIGLRFLSGCAEVDVIAFSVCDVYPSDP